MVREVQLMYRMRRQQVWAGWGREDLKPERWNKMEQTDHNLQLMHAIVMRFPGDGGQAQNSGQNTVNRFPLCHKGKLERAWRGALGM